MTSENTKEKPTKKEKEKIVKLKESEHKKLLSDLKEANDKYIRIFAEFENARKRMDREKIEFIRYANEEIVVEFLTILDGIENSIKTAKEKYKEDESFIKGMELLQQQIKSLLEKNGVKPMDAKDKPFDPHSHEVLMQEDSQEHEEGTVLEEFQKGYVLSDKVIRTAKVKVSKKPTK